MGEMMYYADEGRTVASASSKAHKILTNHRKIALV